MRIVSPQRTFALQRLSSHMPIRRLRVGVVSGADMGKTAEAPSERLTIGTAEGNDLVLTDPAVSRYHLELAVREDCVAVTDLGSTNGTWIGSVRIERSLVPLGTEIGVGRSRLGLLAAEPALEELHPESVFGDLCGESQPMRRLMAKLTKVARSDAAVLIVGESGTGKELMARGLHDGGPRASAPFVTVDCGALSPALVTSELFGHERGAFTSAERSHVGAFERAQGGTIFMDEVGELPSELQTHLLGVLERRRVRRVGGTEDIPVDVRIVSATNRDLRSEVNVGRFRLDLYYRLAVVAVDVPPLRNRSGDVPLLLEHFLRELGHDGAVADTFSPDLVRRLEEHRWPGNVRELRNFVEAALVTGEVPFLAHSGIRRTTQPPRRQTSTYPGPGPGFDLDRPYKDARSAVLARFEAQYLARLMERSGGNVSRAAREAAMTRSHLFELLRRNGLK